MMGFLKTKDRDAVASIDDSSVKAVSRDGSAEEKVLEGVVEDVKKSTGNQERISPGGFLRF
jgi:hypothetical protein